MTLFRAVLCAALLSIFLTSCGETFRPIATVVTPTLPAVQGSKTAVVITSPSGLGTATHYNLSGNTVSGQVAVGQGPVFAAFAGNAGRIYVANAADSTLSFYSSISPQTGTTTITLPSSPAPNPSYIETNLALGSIYVAYKGRDSVGVVNIGSNSQTAEIALPTGAAPVAMVSTPDGKKIFTANSGTNDVSVIDSATNTVSTTLALAGCTDPEWFAIHPDGSYVYVVCKGSGNLFYINTATLATTDVAPVGLGAQPNFVHYDVNRKRLVVTNSGGNTVSVINEDPATPIATYHTVTTITVGSNPLSAAALPDGSKIYVGNSGSNSVTVIDSATLTVKTTVPVAGPAQYVKAAPDSTRVAVTIAGGSPNLTSLNTQTDTIVNQLPLNGPHTALLLIQ